MSFIPSLPPDEFIDLSTFHLAANTTTILVHGGKGDGKAFARNMTDYWFFDAGPILETGEVCEIFEGDSKCVTGVATSFYVCMEIFETGPLPGQP